jgi:T-complex protein 1 subunit delta
MFGEEAIHYRRRWSSRFVTRTVFLFLSKFNPLSPYLETELFLKLSEHANTLSGADAYCFKAFAEALEVIPYTLAENAGLNPIATVTELRNRHAQGEVNTGINVRKGCITNILDENVVQPLLVSTSAINLASETVVSIMKIDDIVNTIRS